MQYKIIFAVGFTLLASGYSLAAEITSAVARKVTQTWLRSRSSAHMSAQFKGSPQLVSTCEDGAGRKLFHVVKLENAGYVITSADDAVDPIVAFSDTGEFEDSPDNPLSSLLRLDMAERLDALKHVASNNVQTSQTLKVGNAVALMQGITGYAKRSRAAWAELIEESTNAAQRTSHAFLTASRASLSDVRVPVLMSTKWNQSDAGGDACYNYYTPNGYVCGCVATAGAQLMRYHCYPTASLAVFTQSCWVDDIVQGKSTKGGVFSWSNMPYEPGYSLTVAQRQAVGKLCYDVGVASRMNWGIDGSGAMLPTLAGNLVSMFGYAQARSQIQKSLSQKDMQKSIYANLDAECPVLLGIKDANGKNGHAIVADGYGYSDQTIYTHLNLGWAGSSDAWYALPDIGTGYNFSSVNVVVYNVFPKKTGELLTGRVTAADGSPISSVTVKATSSGATRTAKTNVRGIYAINLTGGKTWNVVASASGYSEATASVYVDACSDCEITELTYRGCSYCPGSIGNSWGNNFTLTKATQVELSINPSDMSFSAASGSEQLSVSCNGSWTASSSASWATLSAKSGYGNGSLKIAVSANGSLTRTAFVTVSSGSISRRLAVLQKGVSKVGSFTIEDGEITAWDGSDGTDVIIPDGVTAVGANVFKQSAITSVTFPKSLERIGDLSFALCYSLTNVVWGTGLKKIGGQAFAADRGLTECLVLPDGLQRIEYAAFWGIGAEWIVVPKTVDYIAWGAFETCSKLSRIYFDGNAPTLGTLGSYDVSGKWTGESSKVLHGNSEDMSVWVPYGSTGWNDGNSTTLPALWPVSDVSNGDARSIAYYDATKPKLAVDTEDVQVLSNGQKVNIEVRSIDSWYASTATSWITLNRSSGRGFSTLTLGVAENKLSSVRTGSVIVRVGNATVTITVRQQESGVEFLIQDGVLASWSGTGSSDVVIPPNAGIREIGENAFYRNKKITSVSIPASVKKIGSMAFRGCSALTNIVLASGIEEIGYFSFAYCTSLTGTLFIPDTVTFIDTDAFWSANISSVSLPGGLSRISTGAFSDCAKLLNVYFRGNAPSAMGYSDTSTSGNIFEGTPESLIVHVPYGSTGWASRFSAVLPAKWPSGDGENARTIVNYDPTAFTIRFECGGNYGSWEIGSVKDREYKRNRVYTLVRPDGLRNLRSKKLVGWQCSNGRRYDDGVMIFNLANPGETVTMTAIWE